MRVNCLSDYTICNLNEVVWFQEGPGVRKNQFRTSGVKLLNVGNICDRELILDKTSIYISEEEAYGKYKHFLVDEDDLLIASSGIKVEYFDKKITFAKKEHLPLCMNTSTIRFKVIDKNVLDINYFRHFLASKYFTKQVQFYITGSAQLNFGPSHLNKMKIIVPPIDKQREIAKILDKADEIRKKKKLANDKLDEFLKSTFISMFGYKNYEKNCLEYISIGKGEYGSGASTEEYNVNLPRYVRITDITDKGYLTNNAVSPKNESNIDKYSLQYGDILFARSGATVGKTYLYKDKDGWCIFAGYCIRFRLNQSIVNPYYVFAYTQTNEYKAWVKSKQKVVAQPNINAQQYGQDLLIPIPPIDLQNQFAQIVEKVEAQKQKNELVIEQMNNLFNSLSQRAFKGEYNE